MTASLKISANASEARKSILDLSKDVKALGKTKVSVFSDTDRKFLKEELNRELSVMKTKLVENRNEISKMVSEQAKLEKGSKAELDYRKRIIDAYRTQTKLANQIENVQKQNKEHGGFSGGFSKGMEKVLPNMSMGITGMLGTVAAGAAIAVGALAIMKGFQSAKMFKEGAGNRIRLRGLGMESMNMGSPQDLANAGMTEQDFIRRQTTGVSRLGRAGGSRESIMQQAKFERAYGLEEGSMMNVSTSLRAGFGGKGADQAQMKIQASIFASGIEDAIGPYLESVTELLSDINKNGLTNSDEVINMMSQLVKDGKRTPEQLTESFKTLDHAVRGATGEASAFIQTAFARGGIGGGTVGGTRLAMSSGGIFGLSEEELKNRGYNPELIKNMKSAGFTQGVGNRTGALLEQFKKTAGLGKGQKINDITDVNTMGTLSQMSNSILQTQGIDGFDALKMMEQVQNKQMSQKQFEEKIKDMREGKDPQIERLNKINKSLEGQTEILSNINTILMENFGKSTVSVKNAISMIDSFFTGSLGEAGKAIEHPSTLSKNYQSSRVGMTSSDYYDDYMDQEEQNKLDKKGNMPDLTTDTGQSTIVDPQAQDAMAKAVETGMTKAMQSQKSPVIQTNNKINVKVQNSDGRVSEKTHK